MYNLIFFNAFLERTFIALYKHRTLNNPQNPRAKNPNFLKPFLKSFCVLSGHGRKVTLVAFGVLPML